MIYSDQEGTHLTTHTLLCNSISLSLSCSPSLLPKAAAYSLSLSLSLALALLPPAAQRQLGNNHKGIDLQCSAHKTIWYIYHILAKTIGYMHSNIYMACMYAPVQWTTYLLVAPYMEWGLHTWCNKCYNIIYYWCCIACPLLLDGLGLGDKFLAVGVCGKG